MTKKEKIATYMREYDRRPYRRQKVMLSRRVRGEQLTRMIDDLKLKMGCKDCGYNSEAVALDFDHMDSSIKVIAIGTMVKSGLSLNRILEEVAKCEIVCANCHRVRTKRRY